MTDVIDCTVGCVCETWDAAAEQHASAWRQPVGTTCTLWSVHYTRHIYTVSFSVCLHLLTYFAFERQGQKSRDAESTFDTTLFVTLKTAICLKW